MNPRLPIIPLREDGPFVEPHRYEQHSGSDQPRALRSLARIIDDGLCHRCGSCVGICPTAVLGLDSEEYPVVKNLSACTDCDLCVKVCPGDEFDVTSIATGLFGELPDIEDMHGYFNGSYLAYATNTDVRSGSTSGGVVTGILLSMLKRGLIDGAVVIASDENELWRGRPILARTEAEILSAMKSKYAISPTNTIFQEIKEIPGRYALVGLPCQIHGFHKAAELDRRIRERVVLTIGLFCHAAVEHEPMRYIFSTILKRGRKAKRFISRVGKHPGTPYLELDDGTLEPVYFPEAKNYRPSSLEILNILYRLYTPARCLTCYDSTAEFADIAVGDPWMSPPDEAIDFYQGYSFVMTRTARGHEVLSEATSIGALNSIELTVEHAKSSNRMMGVEKRNRAFRVIETLRRQGKSVPEYGIEIPKVKGTHVLPTELNMLSHFFCFVSWGKLPILRFFLSRAGYFLLWLNYLKRRFRQWRKDSITGIRYRLKGETGTRRTP